jgi:hypothetical protein
MEGVYAASWVTLSHPIPAIHVGCLWTNRQHGRNMYASATRTPPFLRVPFVAMAGATRALDAASLRR